MKILFTTTPKPIPLLLGKYLSIDDSSYRFVADQGIFSMNSTNHIYSLHFLAQNVCASSVALEWPTTEELTEELQRDQYDIVAVSCKVIDVDRLDELIDLVRQVSPGTKVVIGGFGTLGLADLEEYGIHAAKRADYICTGEGVDFLNRLIGVQDRVPRVCNLPLERIKVPWLPSETKVGYLLSALGCPVQCEFCATSAYIPGGKVHEVMTPRELYESARWYYDTYPDFHQIYMMDENYLAYKKRVNDVGRLIREDEKWGLSRINMHCFGTILAISKWDPEELLLNGVGGIWSGVESFYSYDRKKSKEVKTLFDTIHAHGIHTTLSWIIGDDCQTMDNIEDDISQFIALKPPACQLSVLTAMPGTPLFRRLKTVGRLRPFDAAEMHLLGNNMDSLHFSQQSRVDIVQAAYRKMYETNGTAVMRGLEIDLNGFETCRKSKHPELIGRKMEYFRRQIRNTIPLVKASIEFAPNDGVKKIVEEIERRYVDLQGPLTKSQRIMADKFLRLAGEAHERLGREGKPPVRDVPLYRVEYPGRSGFNGNGNGNGKVGLADPTVIPLSISLQAPMQS